MAVGCLLVTGTMLAQNGKRGDFVKGADVGFLAGQERRGIVFHDRNGQERECLELLKNDYQIGAIRMRVWVNPRGGDCDKFALLAMARSANLSQSPPRGFTHTRMRMADIW